MENHKKPPRPTLKFVSAKDLDQSKVSFENYTVEDPDGKKLGKLDGFIIDVAKAIPYYSVVNAGGWFHSKHVLIPIGHFALDTESKRLVADLPQERVKRFPGFDLDLFSKLTPQDLDRMADEIAGVCCPDLMRGPDEVISRFEVWAHYEPPAWWDEAVQSGQPPTEDAQRRTR